MPGRLRNSRPLKQGIIRVDDHDAVALQAEFQRRWSTLKQPIADLEQRCAGGGASNAAAAKGMHVGAFNVEEVRQILQDLFLRGTPGRGWLLTDGPPSSPDALKKKVLALLRENLRRDVREWLTRAVFHDTQTYGLRFMGTCRTTSVAVTTLATVVSSHAGLIVMKGAEAYRIIGAIVTAMSTPHCFVCGRGPHRFRDWRAVRARDAYRRGPWDERWVRWRKAPGRVRT